MYAANFPSKYGIHLSSEQRFRCVSCKKLHIGTPYETGIFGGEDHHLLCDKCFQEEEIICQDGNDHPDILNRYNA